MQNNPWTATSRSEAPPDSEAEGSLPTTAARRDTPLPWVLLLLLTSATIVVVCCLATFKLLSSLPHAFPCAHAERRAHERHVTPKNSPCLRLMCSAGCVAVAACSQPLQLQPLAAP
jgi:hypothetical protein